MSTAPIDGEYLVAWSERSARMVGKSEAGAWFIDVGRDREGARVWTPTEKTPHWIGARIDEPAP